MSVSPTRSKKVIILFDLLIPPFKNHDYSKFFKGIEWEAEKSVFTALKKLGHQPFMVGVFDDLKKLKKDILKIKPDMIFNLAEAFAGRRDGEPELVSFLEELGIPFTGNSSKTLQICKDKALTKNILQKAGIKMPAGKISRHKQPLKKLSKLKFPLFIKPTKLESSEGISKDSLVFTHSEALRRIQKLHKRFAHDILAEEFISGRELYVSVFEHQGKVRVLPIRELNFKKYPGKGFRFATYQTKWDEKFRKKWKIENGFAKKILKNQIAQMETTAKKVFKTLKLRSYVRLDFRLCEKTGDAFLLEVNPNPSLSSYDDFARSAKREGMEFHKLVKILLN
ncbi:MAG: ATP-grasp domain-containing protein [Deltaproteobacteria bacterium]|nr:ATP-grasp domain-containing protein [Deltaproteobacteria bacterium]